MNSTLLNRKHGSAVRRKAHRTMAGSDTNDIAAIEVNSSAEFVRIPENLRKNPFITKLPMAIGQPAYSNFPKHVLGGKGNSFSPF